MPLDTTNLADIGRICRRRGDGRLIRQCVLTERSLQAKCPKGRFAQGRITGLGFDAQVNDAAGKGVRIGQRNFNDSTNSGWQSTAGYGLLTLEK